jgi:type III restriction enzyme
VLELKSYQDKAVRNLIEETDRIINSRKKRTKLVFKAPTGAGKTIVMAEYLNRFVQESQNKIELPYRQFAFIWIAPNQLHIQSYEKIKNYFKETRTIRSINFEDIIDNQLMPNDVLFLNWQSISSEDNIYVRDNERDKTLYRYIDNTRINDTEIIVILDEAHLFASKGDKANKVLEKINAIIEIDVSATPLFQSDNKVVIHRDDVVREQMIKKGVSLNPDIEPEKQATQELDYYLLDEALKKRKELTDKNKAEGTNINPLLIIQLPNDSASESAMDRDYKERIIGALKERSITTANHKLAVWLSKEKENLEGIENYDNITEVLIFKQAIALGWDCPRASVLLIFRELKQETFTIQTVGRILRMPEQKHYFDESLNLGIVYTNLSRDIITIVRDDMDYFLENKAVRIDSYQSLSLESSHINRKIIRNRLNSQYKSILFKASENKFGIEKFEETANTFENNIKSIEDYGVEMHVEKIQIPIPRNIEISEVKEEIIYVDKEHQVKFAKTQNELSILFKQFCWQNCGEYAKFDSAPILESAMLNLFEVYFSIYQTNATKIFLYNPNRQIFIDLINQSFADYRSYIEDKAKKTSRKVEKHTWEVPEFKVFNNKYAEYPAPVHVMLPTYLFKRDESLFGDSNVEIEFIQLLENNKANIDWWYRNGDENKADFSIDYINSSEVSSLFFIDFIILFKNKTIGFFDTKSIGSDQEMVMKQNALIDYIEILKIRNKKAVGGIIVKDKSSWRFPKGKIENNKDISDWQIFDIVKIASNNNGGV